MPYISGLYQCPICKLAGSQAHYVSAPGGMRVQRSGAIPQAATHPTATGDRHRSRRLKHAQSEAPESTGVNHPKHAASLTGSRATASVSSSSSSASSRNSINGSSSNAHGYKRLNASGHVHRHASVQAHAHTSKHAAAEVPPISQLPAGATSKQASTTHASPSVHKSMSAGSAGRATHINDVGVATSRLSGIIATHTTMGTKARPTTAALRTTGSITNHSNDAVTRMYGVSSSHSCGTTARASWVGLSRMEELAVIKTCCTWQQLEHLMQEQQTAGVIWSPIHACTTLTHIAQLRRSHRLQDAKGSAYAHGASSSSASAHLNRVNGMQQDSRQQGHTEPSRTQQDQPTASNTAQAASRTQQGQPTASNTAQAASSTQQGQPTASNTAQAASSTQQVRMPGASSSNAGATRAMYTCALEQAQMLGSPASLSKLQARGMSNAMWAVASLALCMEVTWWVDCTAALVLHTKAGRANARDIANAVYACGTAANDARSRSNAKTTSGGIQHSNASSSSNGGNSSTSSTGAGSSNGTVTGSSSRTGSSAMAEALRPQVAALLCAGSMQLSHLNAQELSNVLYASALLGLSPDTSWSAPLLQSLALHAPALSPQAVSNVAWALYRMQLSPGFETTAVLLQRAQQHLIHARCCPAELSMLAWSVAQMGWRPNSAWMAAFEYASLALFQRTESVHGAIHSSNPARLGPGNAKGGANATVLNSGMRSSPSAGVTVLNAQALSNMVSALAHMQYRPTGQWLTALCSTLYCSNSMRLRMQLLPADVSAILTGFAMLGARPSPDLLAALYACLVPAVKSGECSAGCMVDAVWAAAKLQYQPPPALLLAVLEASKDVMHAACMPVAPHGWPLSVSAGTHTAAAAAAPGKGDEAKHKHAGAGATTSKHGQGWQGSTSSSLPPSTKNGATMHASAPASMHAALSASHLAKLAWSLAQLQVPVTGAWLRALWRAVLHRGRPQLPAEQETAALVGPTPPAAAEPAAAPAPAATAAAARAVTLPLPQGQPELPAGPALPYPSNATRTPLSSSTSLSAPSVLRSFQDSANRTLSPSSSLSPFTPSQWHQLLWSLPLLSGHAVGEVDAKRAVEAVWKRGMSSPQRHADAPHHGGVSAADGMGGSRDDGSGVGGIVEEGGARSTLAELASARSGSERQAGSSSSSSHSQGGAPHQPMQLKHLPKHQPANQYLKSDPCSRLKDAGTNVEQSQQAQDMLRKQRMRHAVIKKRLKGRLSMRLYAGLQLRLQRVSTGLQAQQLARDSDLQLLPALPARALQYWLRRAYRMQTRQRSKQEGRGNRTTGGDTARLVSGPKGALPWQRAGFISTAVQRRALLKCLLPSFASFGSEGPSKVATMLALLPALDITKADVPAGWWAAVQRVLIMSTVQAGACRHVDVVRVLCACRRMGLRLSRQTLSSMLHALRWEHLEHAKDVEVLQPQHHRQHASGRRSACGLSPCTLAAFLHELGKIHPSRMQPSRIHQLPRAAVVDAVLQHACSMRTHELAMAIGGCMRLGVLQDAEQWKALYRSTAQHGSACFGMDVPQATVRPQGLTHGPAGRLIASTQPMQAHSLQQQHQQQQGGLGGGTSGLSHVHALAMLAVQAGESTPHAGPPPTAWVDCLTNAFVHALHATPPGLLADAIMQLVPLRAVSQASAPWLETVLDEHVLPAVLHAAAGVTWLATGGTPSSTPSSTGTRAGSTQPAGTVISANAQGPVHGPGSGATAVRPMLGMQSPSAHAGRNVSVVQHAAKSSMDMDGAGGGTDVFASMGHRLMQAQGRSASASMDDSDACMQSGASSTSTTGGTSSTSTPAAAAVSSVATAAAVSGTIGGVGDAGGVMASGGGGVMAGGRDSMRPAGLQALIKVLDAVSCFGAPPSHPSASHWWLSVFRHTLRALSGLTPRQLVALTYSLARTRNLRPPPEWMESLLNLIARGLNDLQPRDFAMLLVALVRLGHVPGQSWLEKFLEQVEVKSDAFARSDHSMLQDAWLGLEDLHGRLRGE